MIDSIPIQQNGLSCLENGLDFFVLRTYQICKILKSCIKREKTGTFTALYTWFLLHLYQKYKEPIV